MNIKTRDRFFRYANYEKLLNRVTANVCAHQWEIQKSLKSNKFANAIRHLDAVIYECNMLETILGNPYDPEEGVREITAQIKEILDYMLENDGVTTLPEKVSRLHMYLQVICEDLDKYHAGMLK
jgi:hypothetical protein